MTPREVIASCKLKLDRFQHEDGSPAPDRPELFAVIVCDDGARIIMDALDAAGYVISPKEIGRCR